MIQSIRQNVTWRAILPAGFIGGTVFLLTNLLLAQAVLEIKPILMIRYIAALVLGSGTLTEGGSAAIIVGLVVHYLLSLIFATLIVLLVHRGGLAIGIVGGAILGLCLYSINLYSLTVFFDWFFAINSVVLALSHLLFGAVVGGVYETLDRYDLPAKEILHETV